MLKRKRNTKITLGEVAANTPKPKPRVEDRVRMHVRQMNTAPYVMNQLATSALVCTDIIRSSSRTRVSFSSTSVAMMLNTLYMKSKV